jgi:hypothetical protein
MKQHAQIVSIYAYFTADFVFVPLLQEYCPQEVAVFGRELLEHFMNGSPALFGNKLTFGIRSPVHLFRSLFVGLSMSLVAPICFEQHVVADCIDVRAQTLGGSQAPVPADSGQYAKKRLLARILDRFRGPEPSSQLGG